MNADYLRNGLLARGLPPHVADAFILNWQDESGLDAGINERAPLVPGSRGGYGLSQWTGPRRVALERFAAERGIPVGDPDVQMDYLMHELSGPEAAAARAIMATSDTGSAAAAILNRFLRPAEAHRAAREARYLGGAASPAGNALGAPDAPQNALAAGQPERPQLRFADLRQDAGDFMVPTNALAPQPVQWAPQRNNLARILG